MTTTAHEYQFTAAPEPVREPMSREAILRRNIADMEVALRAQTELKERAEAELAKLREQKPVAKVTHNHEFGGGNHFNIQWLQPGAMRAGMELYSEPAAPVPASAEWREVMAELAADLQAACDAEHPHRDQYPSVMRKYNNDMEIVEKARALLQSTTPVTAVPAVPEDKTMDRVCSAIADALGDAYDCTRVWSAWSYGTMGQDDFSLVREDDHRLREIADAAISALLQSAEVRHD